MFQGLRTVIYRVSPADLTAATDWYSKILGKRPYFEEPFYVGFNVAGFELGLDPSEEKVSTGDNVQTFWGVQNIQEAMAHCKKQGAKVHSDIRNVGGNIQVATV